MQMSPSRRSPRNAKNKRGRGFGNCPVETGKEYEVDITETSPLGEGVARIKGFLVFVGKAGRAFENQNNYVGTYGRRSRNSH
jgi:hypothetical protein